MSRKLTKYLEDYVDTVRGWMPRESDSDQGGVRLDTPLSDEKAQEFVRKMEETTGISRETVMNTPVDEWGLVATQRKHACWDARRKYLEDAIISDPGDHGMWGHYLHYLANVLNLEGF